MPGKRLHSFSEGDRAEDLAVYVLSAFSAVVPVRRQSDYGVDLFCTLTYRVNEELYAGRGFIVQVKSVSDTELRYGGVGRAGRWKGHEIEWLYGQAQPIIFCIVDQPNLTVRLYSALRMWGARYQWGPMGQVVFVPNEQVENVGKMDEYERTALDGAQEFVGDGFSYRIPLGPPIVEINLRNADAMQKRDEIGDCLEQWLEFDYGNIRYHNTSIPITQDVSEWEPNTLVPNENIRVINFWNTNMNANIVEIIESIAPGVASLKTHFQKQGQEDKLERMKEFEKLVNEYVHLGILRRALERGPDVTTDDQDVESNP